MTSTDVTGISDNFMYVYTWCTYGVVIQIVNICGIVTNIINIICFWRIGFTDSVNVSLLGLAVSDLASLLSMFGICFFLTPAMTTADLSFIPTEVMYLAFGLPHVTFTRVSSCITAFITLERCLCITAPLKVKSLITPERAIAINICFFIIIIISPAPNYVVNTLGWKYVSSRNTTLFGIIVTDDRENVEKISFIINNFSIPFAAFTVIVVCTTILSVQLKKNAKWIEKTATSSQAHKITRRNYNASRMVVMISTLFVGCFVPISVTLLAIAFIPEMSATGKHIKIGILSGGCGYILESFNSSVNIFIYYKMSSYYREAFLKLFYK